MDRCNIGSWHLRTWSLLRRRQSPPGVQRSSRSPSPPRIARIATAVLMLGIMGYRNHPGTRRAACAGWPRSPRRSPACPSWAALPLGVGGGSLLIALLGMYWDISLHIDQGRDPGPLANPAHYLILVGLYGVFASGCLALALPEEKPGPAAIRITRDWYVPVGGVLTAACGGFALLGFPLDDMWHRHLRPGRHALGPDAPDALRRRRPDAHRPGDPARRGPRASAASAPTASTAPGG